MRARRGVGRASGPDPAILHHPQVNKAILVVEVDDSMCEYLARSLTYQISALPTYRPGTPGRAMTPLTHGPSRSPGQLVPMPSPSSPLISSSLLSSLSLESESESQSDSSSGRVGCGNFE